MGKDTISRTQLMALLWAGVMAPAAELLPGILLPQAGKGAWLSVLAAAPLVLAAGWLLGALAGQGGLAREIMGLLGPVIGRGILLIYLLWAELLLTLRLRLCAQRLLSSGSRDGALWFFLAAVAAMVVWMGRGKLSAFARAGQLFLAALLTAAGVVLILALFQAKIYRLFPLWWTDAAPLLRSSLDVGGVIGWGLFAAFLIGSVADQGEKKSWHWLSWGLGGCALLSLAQAVILGNLGAELAAALPNSFFALAKSVGVEGAFQRVEGVITALWTFADLTMAGILVFAVRAMSRELFPQKWQPWIPWACVFVAAAGAMTVFSGAGNGESLSRTLVPTGNLILGGAVPAGLYLLRRLGKKGEDRSTSCDKKSC